MPGDENAERVDPEEPILEAGVYRDPWERKDRPVTKGDARLRDVYAELDWPEPGGYENRMQSTYRASRRLFQQEDEELAAMSPADESKQQNS